MSEIANPNPLSVRPPEIDVRLLRSELTSTRDYLRTVIEEMWATNDELQSANEALLTANEELQAAQEDMRCSVDQLNVLNAVIEERNAELLQVNNDLLNLLTSTNIPIVMTGMDLRIRRFTPTAKKILNLIATDEGRPISDLNPRIDAPDLEGNLRKVIETLEPFEQNVTGSDGRSYLMRMRPYLTKDHRIEGAILQLLDVSDLKRSMDRMNHALAYAEAILDTIHEPLVVLDKNLHILDANRAFYTALDLPMGAGVGSSIYEIVHGSFDIPAVHGLDNLIRNEGQMNNVEIEFRPRNGEQRIFQLNARRLRCPQDDCMILLAVEDITERRRSEEARYRQLFESARDGIAILDAATGEIVDVNPFLQRLLGYDRQEMVGQKYWEIEPLESVEQVCSALAQVRNDGMLRLDALPVRTRDGRTLQADVVANLYSDKERKLVQFNIRDVTERRKFERELQETQKLETLGLLAGGVAHDFNNLLTGIMGHASLAYVKLPPEEPVRQNIREIELASERAAALTLQMLAYAGKGRYRTQDVQIGELIDEILPLVRTSIPRTVEVETDLADGLPSIHADFAQVQQVLMNLVVNGAEAIGENSLGKVVLRTSLRHLSEREAREDFSAEQLAPGPYVQLEVRDTGAGMDEATQSRIFDPFFTTKFTGRGLGLAASLGIVKSHGGAIRVHSSPGHGSTFCVLLPAGKRNPSAPGQLPAGSVILIAGSEVMTEGTASTVLTHCGCKVLSADNGEAGVAMFREHNDIISAVLLDFPLAGIGGAESLRRMRSIRPGVPIVLCSHLNESEALERLHEDGGPDAFLHKPYGQTALLRVLGSVIRVRTESQMQHGTAAPGE